MTFVSQGDVESKVCNRVDRLPRNTSRIKWRDAKYGSRSRRVITYKTYGTYGAYGAYETYETISRSSRDGKACQAKERGDGYCLA